VWGLGCQIDCQSLVQSKDSALQAHTPLWFVAGLRKRVASVSVRMVGVVGCGVWVATLIARVLWKARIAHCRPILLCGLWQGGRRGLGEVGLWHRKRS